MTTLSTLRNAAKASPVEYELVCEAGHEIVLHDGELRCVNGGSYACRDKNHDNAPIAWSVRDLVRSGRTRQRQFTTYPKPEVFR